MIDLSVIVISYNQERFIAHTLESIAHQKTGYTYEILVGDDCSSDRTQDVVKEYARQYPKIVKNIVRENNLGASANIYDLLKRAKGRYIAFCEGDDFWCDEYRIEREVGFLDKRGEYSAICGRTKPIDEDGKEIPIDLIEENKRFWIFEGGEYTLDDFFCWKMPGHLSAITIRNYFKQADRNLEIIRSAHKTVADRSVALIAALNGAVFCDDTVTSCYRFCVKAGGTNFMSKMKAQNYRLDDFLMLRRLEEFAQGEYSVALSLEGIKRERLIGATVVWLKDRSLHNWKVMMGIIRNSGRAFLYACIVARVIVLKLFYWHIKEKDKKIR